MEIEGKVISILPRQEGVGQSGKPWALQPFVIETIESYPKKVCIEIFGDNNITNNPVALDMKVKVSYDLESREFNGRWYTSVRAWKVEDITETDPAQAPAQPLLDPFNNSGGGLFGQQ